MRKARATRMLTVLVPAFALGCGAAPFRPFPLREPVWQDMDTKSVAMPCRPDPKADDPGHRICMPEPFDSGLVWDGADNMIFLPIVKVLEVRPSGEAVNVNAFDEVA